MSPRNSQQGCGSGNAKTDGRIRFRNLPALKDMKNECFYMKDACILSAGQ
jgi:hypothetical protein